MSFANVRNNTILDFNTKYLDKDIVRVVTSDEIYQAYKEDRNKVIYQDGEIILDPDYEAKQAQAEAERIAMLNQTGADVERGIYQAKGMDFDDIVAMVTQLQPEGLDIKALKIELKANNFYRGNPYVNAVGTLLGFTSEQLDKFFETNDYTVLLPPVVEEPTEPEEPVEEVKDEQNTDS